MSTFLTSVHLGKVTESVSAVEAAIRQTPLPHCASWQHCRSAKGSYNLVSALSHWDKPGILHTPRSSIFGLGEGFWKQWYPQVRDVTFQMTATLILRAMKISNIITITCTPSGMTSPPALHGRSGTAHQRNDRLPPGSMDMAACLAV